MSWLKRLMSSSTRLLTRFARTPWYLPVLVLAVAADAYVFMVPTEALLIPAVLMKPKRWFSTAFVVSLASAIGAASFSILTTRYGEPWMRHLFPSAFGSQYWQRFGDFMKLRGGVGLGLISLSPFPQHAAVALAGLARLKGWTVFLAVLLGRLPKYLLVAWLSLHSPKILRKMGIDVSHSEVLAGPVA